MSGRQNIEIPPSLLISDDYVIQENIQYTTKIDKRYDTTH